MGKARIAEAQRAHWARWQAQKAEDDPLFKSVVGAGIGLWPSRRMAHPGASGSPQLASPMPDGCRTVTA